MEKSDASAAYLPSLPSIPMPTFAFCIIPTSFPPSLLLWHIIYPTQATTYLEYFFMHSVTSAF